MAAACAPKPLRLQLDGAETAVWDPFEIQCEDLEAGEKRKEENIKYIVK